MLRNRSRAMLLAITLTLAASMSYADPVRADEGAAPAVAVAVAAAQQALVGRGPRRHEPEPHRDWAWSSVLDIRSFPSFLLFAGGALSALTLHELGHVFANLALGNVPTIGPVLYGKAIPWFVIDSRLTLRHGVLYKHDGGVFGAGEQGFYVINEAGFMMQNIGSEIMLSTTPGLIYERAPFFKGALFMNTFLSLGYSTASFLGTEDPHGDIAGGAKHSDYPRQLIAGMVFSHGALDLLRYLFPETDWLPWLSRSTKMMFLGMDFRFD